MEEIGPTDTTWDWHPDQMQSKIYLGLSGGGFRATAHHMGVLLAFLRYDFINQIEIISGVSGGAIAAAHFVHWSSKQRIAGARKRGREALLDFAVPLIEVVRLNIIGKILTSYPIYKAMSGLFGMKKTYLERYLDKNLFGNINLNELYPPLTVFTTTDLVHGMPFYLTSCGLGFRPHSIIESWLNQRASSIGAQRMSVSRAVATSAAYPLFFKPIPIVISGIEADDLWNTILRYIPINSPYREGKQEKEYRLYLTDGGLADNRGITFWTELVTRKDTPGILDTFAFGKIYKILCFDVSKQESFIPTARLRRIKSLMRTVDTLSKAKEELNDRLLRALISSSDINYYTFKAVPELEKPLGIPYQTLDKFLQIRTDLDRFSDTEIFVSAYIGYRLAIYALNHINWDETTAELMSDDEYYNEFSAIFDGVLNPNPKNDWYSHLKHSHHRLSFIRSFKRYSDKFL